MLTTALLASLLCTRVPPQTPDLSAMQQRFVQLAATRQAEVLSRIEGRIRQLDDPLGMRIHHLAQEARDPRLQATRTFHDPRVFAPVAPTRTLVEAGSPAWRKVRSDFPAVRPLRDFHPHVIYDWAHGAPCRLPTPPDAGERFANFLHGYHPDADAAVAAALVWLDRDADQRALAHWCEQLYADRNGQVFSAVTLYEAWYTGRTVEVPDVDAIAFARLVLHTEAYVSPIPDGARRDRLYRQVHAAFAQHRTYRTLCEAAAAAFVNITPALDPTYAPLVDRMHLLWTLCGYDVGKCAQKLSADTRAQLLQQLDDRLRDDPDARAATADSKAAMRALAERIVEIATAALAGA